MLNFIHPIRKASYFSRVLILLAGVAALSISGCVISPAAETREANFNVTGSAELDVTSLNGHIEIDGDSGNVVAVQSVLKDSGRLRYEAVQNGNQITVTAARIGGWWTGIFGGPSADIHVTVPANTTLTLETSNGRITVTGTENGGTIETSNGGITLQNVQGRFDASSSNGKIQVAAMNGSGFFRTSNGGVDLGDVAGDFDVSTSNGAITFSGEMKPGGQNRLTTSNAAVNVVFKGTPSVSLDAATSNGGVKCEVPILLSKTGNSGLSGTIGAGDAKLYIRTSNGGISIK